MGIFIVHTAEAKDSGLASKYYEIVPGVSTRSDVERVFPVTTSREFHDKYRIDFHAEQLAIGIKYSTGKCGDYYSFPDWGKFSEWTVVHISYTWPNDIRIPLKNVILDQRKFVRTHTGDVTIHDTYVNEEYGIDVIYDTKQKSVVDIFLKPAAKFKAKYAC